MFRKNLQSTSLARRGESGLSPWSPWNAIEDMHRQMDDLFGHAFGFTPLSQLIPSETGSFEPAVDLYETDNELRLSAALPGFAPENIQVEATGSTVTIQGQRESLPQDEKAVTHRRSWMSSASNFSVSYTLPVEIDPNNVKATFRHGVPELELPKAESARPRGVKVDISGS